MKKTFTILIAALMLLTMISQPTRLWGQTYKKVTSGPTGTATWDGEYLLVYENGSTAFVWTGVDAVSCYKTASISSGTISKPDDAVSLTIASMTGGYSVKVNGGTNDGKYTSNNGNSNGITFNTNAVANTLTYENSATTISCGGKKFRYNKSSGQTRFRYFGSEQEKVQLYERQYTLTYAKTGSGTVTGVYTGTQTNVSSNTDMVKGTQVTLTAAPADGWEFSGWSVNGTGAALSSTSTNPTTFTMGSANATVTATFSQSGSTYTVTYDANGATSGSVPSDGNSYEANATVTVLGNTGNLVKTGNAFSGWCMNAEGTGTVYGPNNTTSFSITSNTTLYANWTPYTITAASNNNDYGTVQLNGTVITATPAAGYTYASTAYTVSSGSATVVQNGNEFTVTPSSNCTVTINFAAIPTHTATFSVNGTTTSSTFYEGQTIQFPANPAAISGKSFIGWLKNNTITGTTNEAPSIVNTSTETMGNSDVTYYAVFADVEEGADTYEKLNSSSFDTNAKYVIGATQASDNNTMWYFNSYSSNTANINWGVMTNDPENNSPIKFTLSGSASALYAQDESGNYLTGLTTGKFRMSSSSTAVALTATGTILNTNNGSYNLRHNYNNGSGGLRWYNNTTGTSAYFYKVISGDTYSNYCTTVSSLAPSINADDVQIDYNATSGEISYTINNPVDGGTVTAAIQSGDFLSKLDHTTYSNKVTFEASVNESTSERESVVRITYKYNTRETVTKDVTVTQAGVPTYTVSYNAGGGAGTMTDTNSPYVAGATVTLLTNTFTAPEDKMWDSWQVKDEDDVNVIVTDGKFTMPAKNVTVTAQWTNDPNAPTYAWVETSLASLTSNDIFVIVGTRTKDDDYKGSYALSNDKGTSASPDAISVTIANGRLTDNPFDNIKWNISGNSTDGYTFYPAGNDKAWLYCTSSNTGVRVGTNNNKTFSIDVDGGYMIHAGTSRYLGVYQDQDWRCYTTIHDNIKNQSFTFYKRVLAKEITGVENYGGYYLISSPIATSFAPTKANGFLRDDNQYDLYCFDQSQEAEWQNYKQSHENFTSIESGKGYLYANKSNTTLLFYGTAYNGNGNVTLSFFSDAEFEGWNLIGNPFPSKAYLADNRNFYRMNAGGTEIIISDDNSLITPMEGIFVHAEDANDKSVTFTTTTPSKRTSNSRIILNIIGNNDNVIDRAIVRLGEGSSLEKLMINNDNTKVYIPQDNVQYALAVSNAKGNMPVNFKAAEMGKYNISVNVEGIDMDYLHLIDRLTGKDVNLLLDNSYSFIATKQDMESRFILSFTANGNNNETDETFAYQNGSEIIVTGSGELQIFDVTGRSVMTTTINGYESVNVSAQGVYILRLIGTEIKTQKIVVR